MVSKVKQILNNSSNEIWKISSDFKVRLGDRETSLKENPFEHPILLMYMTEVASVFQKISKFNLQVAMVLNNNFIEPLNQFHGDSSKHNIKIFKELEALVTNLEKNKKAVKAARDGYYQLSSNAEKSEGRLQLTLHKSNLSEKDLAREVQKNEQLKVFSQEARVEYEKRCKDSTEAWAQFRGRFLTNFGTFDLKEENRVDMIKRKGMSLSLDLYNLYKSENPVTVASGHPGPQAEVQRDRRPLPGQEAEEHHGADIRRELLDR